MPAASRRKRSRQVRVVPGQFAAAFQATLHDDEDVPALVSVLTGLHNLPRARSSFVGRRRDIQKVRALVSTSPLVTITGPSGMGKTRLAVEVACRLAPTPPDGVWLVELALVEATDEPERVAEAVASVLDVIAQPGQSSTEAVVNRLRAATAVVVLDNCEHLAPAAAALADELLAGCGGLRILATGHGPLGVAGEQVWPLGPLSLLVPGRRPADSDAVMLFHARATAVNPGFVMTDAGAAAVADACRRLDGIPLAIELAAARTAVLSPLEIAEHLGERFALLTGGSPATVARHQTLLAALDWTWELLSPPERALLRRLSVFAGGAGLAEVRAVCVGGEVAAGAVLDLLSALVMKSLVVADTTGARARYRLLETVRAYGRARLEDAGEAVELGELHAHWFLELAEDGWHQLVAVGDNERSAVLEADHDNLRAALVWFLADSDARPALRMGSALAPFWKARGHFREGREWLERALALGDDVPPGMRVRGLWGAGILSLMQGDLDRATSALEESVALARHHGYERPAMEAHNVLAFICVFTKDPLTALPLLEESVAWARSRHDNGSLATSLALYGRAHLFSGDTGAARAVFEECRELGRSTGGGADSKGGVGLGWVALTQGRHEEAARLFDEVLATVRRNGDRFETALVLSFLGELAWRRGDHPGARTLLDEGVELALAMGAPFPLSRCLLGLGRVAQAEGDLEAAVGLVDDAAVAARRAGFVYMVARCLVVRADLDRRAGDLGKARDRLDEALATATAAGDRVGVALALRPLATLARIGGDYQRSTSLHLESLDLQVATSDVGGTADTLDGLAGLAVAQGRADHGARLLGAAHGLRRAAGSIRSPADGPDHDVDTALARAALDVGTFEQAFAQGTALSPDAAVALATRSRGGPKRPASGWASLTATQRHVVDLVAEGLTNPEIAERMFLSARTVQGHLLKAFPKLGVHSRQELREEKRRQQ